MIRLRDIGWRSKPVRETVRKGQGSRVYQTFEKPARLRCDEYLKWVRLQPCAFCGVKPPSQACHITPPGVTKSSSSKVSDYFTLPGCARCHERVGSGTSKLEKVRRLSYGWYVALSLVRWLTEDA